MIAPTQKQTFKVECKGKRVRRGLFSVAVAKRALSSQPLYALELKFRSLISFEIKTCVNLGPSPRKDPTQHYPEARLCLRLTGL